MVKIIKVDYVGNSPILHLYSDNESDSLPTDKIGMFEICHGSDCIIKEKGKTTKVKIFSETTREWLEL